MWKITTHPNLTNDLFPTVIERQFVAQMPYKYTMDASVVVDPVRKIFINFLTQSITQIDTVLKRVEQKYPDMFTA